jgi:large subunit ribosomal protein L4
MSKLPICNMKGESLGEFDLADELLTLKRGAQAIHDVVVAHRAKLRAGTASTLRKGEVAGSNKKPWQQKGTGRARAGYRQSPVWRGGGVVFGPHPRSYEKKVTKKSARLAFRLAFSQKVAAGQVVVIDNLSVSQPKTREFTAILKVLQGPRGVLFVVDKVDRNLALASRNVPRVALTTSANVHTFQLLEFGKVVVSQAALAQLQSRLKVPAGRRA